MMMEDSARDDAPAEDAAKLEGAPDTPLEPAGDMPREPVEQAPIPAVEPRGRPPSIVGPDERAVDPRSVEHARLVGLATISAVSLIPLVGISLGWGLGRIPGAVYFPLLVAWAVLLGVALGWAYRWPALHHRYLRYRVDEEGVLIRRGVLWRKVISIPTSRVQHTDVSQGPLQRHYELATLTVYTAGTEGASIELSGLEQTVARRLRDHLLPEHVDDGVA